MRNCVECAAEMGDADRFCGICGAAAASDAPREATARPVRHPLLDEISDKPIPAEVFSIDEADEAPLEVRESDIDVEGEDREAFKPGEGVDIDLALPEEDEVEIGAPNVAIVSLDGEAEEGEEAPIEATPEEFLPDIPERAAMLEFHDADEVIAVEPEEEIESVEPEEGSDVVIEITPELRPDIDYGSMAGAPSGGSTGGGARSSKLQPLAEGVLLAGRYEIVKRVGGGGMGAVYLATDRNLGGAQRAVKEMVQSHIEAEQQEKAINDFKREGLLLTSLEHPSIPTIYDYFFDESECRFYLVMRYIPGGDLATRLRVAPEGKLDETAVTAWAIEIADVLDYLHRHEPPIVYRDLKPANVMLDSNTGKVMLIDFGIARWINKEERGVTAVGTMGYAPPELFSGNVEPRSDIYSLGSTMFHLLTGADPQSNPLLIFDFDKNPRPRQINPRLSEQIEAILMKAVQYDAHARFRSAAEMRDVLLRHLDDLSAERVTYGSPLVPPVETVSNVFCGFCGKPILPTDMFCSYCGRQQASVQGLNAPTFRAKPGGVRLHLVGTGGLPLHTFQLEKDVTLIGRRDPASDIFPEVDLSKYDSSAKISRRHARISRTPSGFMVEDLGSANGTILFHAAEPGLQLSRGRMYELRSGDRVRIGDATLEFVLE